METHRQAISGYKTYSDMLYISLIHCPGSKRLIRKSRRERAISKHSNLPVVEVTTNRHDAYPAIQSTDRMRDPFPISSTAPFIEHV
jgi:phosphoribosylanthranilate isomerase